MEPPTSPVSVFATSIGLCWNGRPLLGTISVPYLQQLYHCCPGVGAFCSDDPIAVSQCDELQDSLLVTGFAYDRHTRLDNNYAEFCWMTHRTHGVRRGGAAAVDLAFVAAGLLDGYWGGVCPWDLAAGVALVQQAGGTVTAYDGGGYWWIGKVLAANQALHQQISRELAKISPLEGACFREPELGTWILSQLRFHWDGPAQPRAHVISAPSRSSTTKLCGNALRRCIAVGVTRSVSSPS